MAPLFPLLKMAVLFTTRVSRPFNMMIMRTSKQSQLLTRYVIMPPAQIYHWFDVRWKMSTLDLQRPRKIPRLSDVEATELGAAIWAEGLIMIIGSTFLVTEGIRLNKAAARREAEKTAKIIEYEARIAALEDEVSQQSAALQELTHKRFTSLRKTKGSSSKSGGGANDIDLTSTAFYKDLQDHQTEKRHSLFTSMLSSLGSHI